MPIDGEMEDGNVYWKCDYEGEGYQQARRKMHHMHTHGPNLYRDEDKLDCLQLQIGNKYNYLHHVRMFLPFTTWKIEFIESEANKVPLARFVWDKEKNIIVQTL